MKLPLIFVILLIFIPVTYSVDPENEGSIMESDRPTIPSVGNSNEFIENVGQLPPRIKFYTGGDPSFALLEDSISIITDHSDLTRTVQLTFPGSSPDHPIGLEQESTSFNYFMGSQSHTDVESYGSVIYGDLYPNVDLLLRMEEGSLKYDLVVGPGGDPSRIRINYLGAISVDISEGKRLIVDTGITTIVDGPLISYQENSELESRYVPCNDGIGIEIPDHDPSSELIIDPLIEASTLVGGGQWERYSLVECDPWDNVIVVGETDSDNYPTTAGSYDNSYGDKRDLFVAKFDPDLEELIFATYIGGSNYDDIGGIAVGDDGSVFISGKTASDDYPTTSSSHQEDYSGGSDGFLTHLSGSGSSILYSTYIGGTSTDFAVDLDLDSKGCPVVVAYTKSNDMFCTDNAYMDRLRAEQNGYLIGFDSNGSVDFATYFGGTGCFDIPYAIVMDSYDRPIVGGQTCCSDYPTTSGAFETDSGGYDAFVTAFDPNGTDLYFSTFIGIASWVKALDISHNGTILMTGLTRDIKKTFPLTDNAFDRNFSGAEEGFLAGLSHNGSRLYFSTYLGGTENKEGEVGEIYHEDCLELCHDSKGWIYVTGYTDSPDLYTTKGAHDKKITERECVLYMVNPDGSGMKYCTYLGGFDEDTGTSVAMNSTNMLYVTGSTYSNTHYTNFPTTEDAYDRNINGGYDTFITRYKTDSFIPGPPANISFKVSDGSVNLTWDPPIFDGNEEILSYNVYRGRFNNFRYAKVEGNGIENRFFNSTNLTNGKEYFFFVGAVNVVGEGRLGVINATPKTVPGKITGLGTSSGNRYINVSWNRPYDGGAPPLKYNVYFGEDNSSLKKISGDQTDRYLMIENLTNGKVYHVSVSASNEMGEGPLSDIHNETPYGLPSVPLNFKAMMGSMFANLSWDPPIDDGGSGNISYQVYIFKDGVPSLKIGGDLRRTYYNASINNGKRVSFVIRCINEEGAGPFTDPIKVLPLGPFSEPWGLTLNYTADMIELKWLPPNYTGGAEILTYNVYAGSELGLLEPFARNLSREEVIFSDVVEGRTYFFRVHAFNGRWEGRGSQVVNITPYSVPSTPRELSYAKGDRWISLYWKEPADLGGYRECTYRINWGTDPLNPYYTKDTGETFANFSGIEMGILYYFTVYSVNPNGIGGNTTIIGIRSVLPPTEPVKFSYDFGDGKLILEWGVPREDNGAAIQGYVIYLGVSEGNLTKEDEVRGDRTYTISGLENGVDYWISVSAYNSEGEGEMVDPLKARPLSEPSKMGRPALIADIDYISISWTYPDNDGGDPVFLFHIYRNGTDESMEKLKTIGSGERSYVDYDVAPGTNYTYSLAAENSVGISGRSETASATTKEPDRSDNGDPNQVYIWGGALLLIIVFIVIGAVILFLTSTGRDEIDGRHYESHYERRYPDNGKKE